MENQNEITVKSLYWFNKKLYELFETLVDSAAMFDSEIEGRLEILNKFFITYKYPKLLEFGHNIIEHNGEDGDDESGQFIANSYEFFLKETDSKLYSIFRKAEDVYRDQYQIIPVLNGTKHSMPDNQDAVTSESVLPF